MGYVGKVIDTAGNTHLVGSTLYGTCATEAATAAKAVTCSDFSELVTGVTVHVKFTYSNTASNATMNVNSTGAKSLCGYGTTRVGTTEATSWKAGALVSFTYDGVSWVMNDYIVDTDTKNTAGSTSSTSKLFLIGATSQASNPQTYSNAGVYATNGALVCGTISTDGTNSYELGAACAKGVDTSITSGSTSTNVPTSAAVANYVAGAVTGATAFQGSLVANGTPSSGTWDQADIEAASYVKGWYWVCSTAGTYCGQVLEAGDMLFCIKDKGSAYAASDFTAVQNNIETLTTTEIDSLWSAA